MRAPRRPLVTQTLGHKKPTAALFRASCRLGCYSHKSLTRPYSVVSSCKSPYAFTQACIVRSAETVLEISNIIQFARQVFEKRIVQGELSCPDDRGRRRRSHSLLTQCHMRSAICAVSALLQRCIPIRGHGHRAAEIVSIDILLSFVHNTWLSEIYLFSCIYHIINRGSVQ